MPLSRSLTNDAMKIFSNLMSSFSRMSYWKHDTRQVRTTQKVRIKILID